MTYHHSSRDVFRLLLGVAFLSAILAQFGAKGAPLPAQTFPTPTITIKQFISGIFAPKAGEGFNFEVMVTGSSVAPTGQVVFNVNGQDISTVSLNGGTLLFALTLNAGNYTILAKYSGDAN